MRLLSQWVIGLYYLKECDEDVRLGVDQHEDGQEGGETTVEHCWPDLSQGAERQRLT